MALIECKECKHQVSDSAKVCPSCGKKISPTLGVFYWAAIIFTALLVIGTAPGKHNEDDSKSALNSASNKSIAQEQVMRVAIDKILSDYESNEISADNTYKGKLIQVSGIVGDIKKDITNSLYVTIGTGEQFQLPVVQAFFDNAKSSQLAELQKGQQVTVVCRVNGLMMNVLVKNCALQ